jgi:hypothetical protein
MKRVSLVFCNVFSGTKYSKLSLLFFCILFCFSVVENTLIGDQAYLYSYLPRQTSYLIQRKVIPGMQTRYSNNMKRISLLLCSETDLLQVYIGFRSQRLCNKLSSESHHFRTTVQSHCHGALITSNWVVSSSSTPRSLTLTDPSLSHQTSAAMLR